MGLNQKIVNVMRAVTSITKSGVNPHFGYKYVRTEDLLPAVREAMIEQGLVMTMSADEVMVHERRQVDFNGKQRERAVIVVKFIIHLYDVESDELRAFVWFGEADASDD
ncbi:MAG: ERF family protein, partial [Gammaproteobacteria bacterium]|nr:ERF family protein [Gammaproteobacteria bacterium]